MRFHNLENITYLPKNQIFVFGSNLAGKHGRGAALTAKLHFGARQGTGFGLTGRSYAIPTKDTNLKSLVLPMIESYVAFFLGYASTLYKDKEFIVTPIGCGLAGYTPKQIAPMFKEPPNNVILPIVFKEYLM